MRTIRVVAPSRSLGTISEKNVLLATEKLTHLGFIVEFGKNASQKDEFYSSSIEERIEDLHESFTDNSVDIVLSALGGSNSNQLLDYIDYDLIERNHKVICGFSDIVALLNAIYAKTSVVTYCGPNFHSFAMKQGLDSTIDSFEAVVSGQEYQLVDPEYYSDDKWYDNQDNRVFKKNTGMIVVNEGEASGIIVGGNLCTFNLLQGTAYMPDLNGKVLFLEDDDMSGDAYAFEFDRNIQSIIHQQGFKNVKGIVIGRSQSNTNMDYCKWEKIIKSKPTLEHIPIVINANFGHTTPMATIPIGGECTIIACGANIEIKYRAEPLVKTFNQKV